MNLGDLDLYSVHYNHPRLEHSSSRQSIAASNGALSESELDYAGDTESVTTAETVLHWSAHPEPQDHQHEKSQSEASLKPLQPTRSIAANAVTIPRTEEEQLRSRIAEVMARPIIDEFESPPPTPIADDTPYIRYAIDQLTRDHDLKASRRPVTETSEESYPVERMVHDEGLGYVQSVRRAKTPPVANITPNITSNITPNIPKAELFIPVEPQLDSPQYPDLTFRPMILRPLSMITLLILCLLATVLLMFCAVYSSARNGLADYIGGLYGAQYFLFQFLPQILAAAIQLYIESVISAVARMVPYTMMASDDSHRRSNALFLGLYSGGIQWPRFDYLSSGEPLLFLCSLLIWPIFITIPLQSSLFSVINVNGIWRWTAVQGVVWTLIAIYIMAIISLAGIAIHFSRRSTGLIWDPRSLADIVALLPRSNILDEYQDTEILSGKGELRSRLAVSSERLGYWRTNNALQEIFYCIGEEGAPTRRYTIQDGRVEKAPFARTYHGNQTSDLEAASTKLSLRSGINRILQHNPHMFQHRYIPWYLRDAMVLLWPIAAFFLLLAVMIVSFLPSTALRNGFLPLVPAGPNSAGFSPANFLYSFVPSVLGLLIYSAFRSLALMVYRLAPWAALSATNGATASESLLVEYTASFPLLAALANRHKLVALLAILSPLNILVPVLAGGIFFPIQLMPSNKVYMLPNLAAFYVILGILILAVVGLASVAVSFLGAGRKSYHLPHPVSCLAEIISFLYASDIVHDAAFKRIRSKADLVTRLVGRRERGLGRSPGREIRYGFGAFKGRDGATHLGAERLKPEYRGKEWFVNDGGSGNRSTSRFST